MGAGVELRRGFWMLFMTYLSAALHLAHWVVVGYYLKFELVHSSL